MRGAGVPALLLPQPGEPDQPQRPDSGRHQRQGLTFLHLSAQPEPFLTQNTLCKPFRYPLQPRKHPLNSP